VLIGAPAKAGKGSEQPAAARRRVFASYDWDVTTALVPSI
jgi:hypothetical protein